MNNLRVADDLVDDWVDDIVGVAIEIEIDFGGIRTLV